MSKLPTPLILVGGNDTDVIEITTKRRIKDSKGEIAVISVGYDEPFDSEQRDYAAHIVLCVNAHEELVEALKKAVEIIKVWHACDEVWDIYFRSSPEMAPVRLALSKVEAS